MNVSWAKVITVEADRNLIVDKIIFGVFPSRVTLWRRRNITRVDPTETLICSRKSDDVRTWVFWTWDHGFVFNRSHVIDIVVWSAINGKSTRTKKKAIGWRSKAILVRAEIRVHFKTDIVTHLPKKYIAFIQNRCVKFVLLKFSWLFMHL